MIEDISKKVLDEILPQSDKFFQDSLREKLPKGYTLDDNMVEILAHLLRTSQAFTVDYVNQILKELSNAPQDD